MLARAVELRLSCAAERCLPARLPLVVRLALNRSIAGILLIRLSGRISYGLISVNNLIWCL